MPNYPHILARLRRTVWASTPETVDDGGARRPVTIQAGEDLEAEGEPAE